MSAPESGERQTATSSSGGSESELVRALARHLSADEKRIRDHEVAEQANRYFGGLNASERRLLGMETRDASGGADAGEVLAECAAPTRENRGDESTAGVWLRALFCTVAFGAIFCWVVLGK